MKYTQIPYLHYLYILYILHQVLIISLPIKILMYYHSIWIFQNITKKGHIQKYRHMKIKNKKLVR